MQNNGRMTLYVADCVGNKANTVYQNRHIVCDVFSMTVGAKFDHVCAEYHGNHRSEKDFVAADCLPMDCDNDHSDNPADWKTPADVRVAFPGVRFWTATSRNHMKPKDGKAARPKHHYYFPIAPVTSADEYKSAKRRAWELFPAFDKNALDAARFFFGHKDVEVEYHDGTLTLTEFLQIPDHSPQPTLADESKVCPVGHILSGERNNHMSKFAGRVLKKYGVEDGKAYKAFLTESAKCSPALATAELGTIWQSALRFYHSQVKNSADYVPPTDYSTQNWRSQLSFKENGQLKPSTCNLELIMANDKRVINFGFNELSGQIEKTGKVPWATKSTVWGDRDDVQFKSWLVHNYTSWSEAIYNNTLLKTADDRAFHPVRNFLETLPKWDGVLRLDRLFVDYLGAPDTSYVHAVTRKIHVAGIARTYKPGIKFDTMCVLVGPQGIGKSMLISKMGGDWYTDGLKVTDIQDHKKAAEKLQGYFIIEVSELAGLKKVEVEMVKSFISCQNDNYREAYARRAIPHPRQCVFFGTSNSEDGFLRDITGNRRYWVLDTPGTGKHKPWDLKLGYIRQVWAEALFYYNQSESLLLPPELNKVAELAQRRAMEPDDRSGLVHDFLEVLLPPEDVWEQMECWQRHNHCHGANDPTQRIGTRRRDFVSNIEVWVECLGKRKEDIQPKDSYAIAAIMKQLPNWQKADKPVKIAGYGLQRGYKRLVVTEL